MTTMRLLSAAALAALVATPALAQGRSTPPPRPIPYAQLDAYLAASPRERQTRDWWAGAQTGAAVNASATAPLSSTALATDPATGAQVALPPSTSPAMEAGPMSNGATAATAAQAGTLNPSGVAPTGSSANTSAVAPGAESNSQVGQGEAGEATSGGTTTPK